jgi:hypothetical protein
MINAQCFDTVDLQDAKALIETLAPNVVQENSRATARRKLTGYPRRP